jgi:hypothetical protein
MPDTWRDTGGTVGNIDMLDGKLVVCTSRPIQRAVADFLAQLRHPIKSP